MDGSKWDKMNWQATKGEADKSIWNGPPDEMDGSKWHKPDRPSRPATPSPMLGPTRVPMAPALEAEGQRQRQQIDEEVAEDLGLAQGGDESVKANTLEDVSSPAQPPSSAMPADRPATGTTAASGPELPQSAIQAWVDGTNAYRAKHNATGRVRSVSWNARLAEQARNWTLLCEFNHEAAQAANVGQNLMAWGESSDSTTDHISESSDEYIGKTLKEWYTEKASYVEHVNYGNEPSDAQMDFATFKKFGHFTQLVWAGTTHIGCAQSSRACTPLSDFDAAPAAVLVMCNYDVGNTGGDFQGNVLSPHGGGLDA